MHVDWQLSKGDARNALCNMMDVRVRNDEMSRQSSVQSPRVNFVFHAIVNIYGVRNVYCTAIKYDLCIRNAF